jgi:adenylate kinase family enzyme
LQFISGTIQGAGKGTICHWLIKDFPQIQMISTGDLIRSHMRNETDLGQKVKSLVQQGHLVPDPVVNELIQCELQTRWQSVRFVCQSPSVGQPLAGASMV